MAAAFERAPLARVSKNYFSDTVNEVLTYKLQQIITGDTVSKVAFVLALTCPYVIASAAFYRSLSNESWFNAIYKSYCTLFRTPGSVNRESAVGPAIVLNIVFLYGLFFFAVFLGLITEDITGSVTDLREGLTPVAVTGHVVVCNWNESTPALLRQLALASKARYDTSVGDPIVVLANRAKRGMDQEVNQQVYHKVSPIKIETRRGMPHKLTDLRRVRVNSASTVFIMHPDGNTVVSPPGSSVTRLASSSERDALKVAAALHINAMTATSSSSAKQRLIIQDTCTAKPTGYVTKFQQGCLSDPDGLQTVPVEPFDEGVLTCLTAQTACRPGLVNLTSALLTYKTHDERLRYVSDPSIAGRFYGNIRRHISNAVVVGYQSSDGHTTKLNPSDWDRLSEGDRLLVISKDPKFNNFEAKPFLSEEECEEARHRMSEKIQLHNPPRNIMVLNWEEDAEDLMKHFAHFASPGTVVTFVGKTDRQGVMPDRMGNVRFKQVVSAAHVDGDALLRAGWKKTDAVVIGADRSLSDEAYDARLISSIMVLQHHYNTAGCTQRLHIVAPILDPDSLPVINHILQDFGAAKERLAKADPAARAIAKRPSPEQEASTEGAGAQASKPSISIISKAAPPSPHTNGPSSGAAQAPSSEELVTETAAGETDAVLHMKGMSETHVTRKLREPPQPRIISTVPAKPSSSLTNGDKLSAETSLEDSVPLANMITAELFLPRDFATGLLVHVAQEPALVHVLRGLFDKSGGHAIFLRSARFFRLTPGAEAPVPFGLIEEFARARGETAIGIMTREGDLKLAPPPNYEYAFRVGDRVAVLVDQDAVTSFSSSFSS